MNLSRSAAQPGPRARRQAYTLTETIVGMAVFGISALALYSGLASGYTSLEMARENLRANQILVEKMEAIRLYSWDRLNDARFLPPTFQVAYDPAIVKETNAVPSQGVMYAGTVSVTDPGFTENYRNRLKLVTVRLNWTTRGVARSRVLSSLVGFDGLHAYVYR